jgi:hypothetical protein
MVQNMVDQLFTLLYLNTSFTRVVLAPNVQTKPFSLGSALAMNG